MVLKLIPVSLLKKYTTANLAYQFPVDKKLKWFYLQGVGRRRRRSTLTSFCRPVNPQLIPWRVLPDLLHNYIHNHFNFSSGRYHRRMYFSRSNRGRSCVFSGFRTVNIIFLAREENPRALWHTHLPRVTYSITWSHHWRARAGNCY